jgi:exonuclease SbcD
LADEVRTLFPEAVDVVVEQPGDDDGGDGERQRSTRTGRTPQELFGDYLAEQGISDERLAKLFAELVDESHAA